MGCPFAPAIGQPAEHAGTRLPCLTQGVYLQAVGPRRALPGDTAVKFGSGRGRRDVACTVVGRSAAPAAGSSDLCSGWWVGCSYVGSPSPVENRRCEDGEAGHDVSSAILWPPRAAGRPQTTRPN